jgi:hypothetical protein
MQPRAPLRSAAGVSSVIRSVHWLAMARAPGGKAGADSPSVHRDTGRLVAFSDAVFAIIITFLVLEIRPPTDYSNLLHGLLALWPSYLAYGVVTRSWIRVDEARRLGAGWVAPSPVPGISRGPPPV